MFVAKLKRLSFEGESTPPNLARSDRPAHPAHGGQVQEAHQEPCAVVAGCKRMVKGRQGHFPSRTPGPGVPDRPQKYLHERFGF